MAQDSYLVFSLKYRPQTFDEIRCQEPVKETLKKAILNNRVAHSYLFCGPRGVGKTTTARILAKALNCEKGPTITPDGTCASCREIAASRSMDVIEIDGASNRQIDDIRELRENIKYAPSSGRFKIYIIDEVHMLTDFAFNALLKTLEEPPRHAKFIFATTAPHKVPSTILSRCQRFDFRKATVEELVNLLRDIVKREKVKVDEEALFAIARRADGSIRDSETILDQMSAFRPEGIGLEDVERLLGIVPSEVFFQFAALLPSRELAPLIQFVDGVFDRGYSVVEFFSGMAYHLRSLLALKIGLARDLLGLSPADIGRLEEQSARFTSQQLSKTLETLIGFEEEIKYSLMPRIQLEVMALKLASLFGGSANDLAAPVSNQATSDPGSRPKPVVPAGVGKSETRVRAKPIPANNLDNEAKLAGNAGPDPEGQALWDRALTDLRAVKPLLANVLDAVAVVAASSESISISRPEAPMYDETELLAELTGVEAVLARLAGHPVKLLIQPEPGGVKAKTVRPKDGPLDKFRAVYDCEEL